MTILGSSTFVPLAGAEIIYDRSSDSSHIVTSGASTTEGRPFGSRIGNTVRLDGSDRYVMSIRLRLGTTWEKPEPQRVTLALYEAETGEDPRKTDAQTPGKLLATAETEVNFEKGSAFAEFMFDAVLVPDTISFIAGFAADAANEKNFLGVFSSEETKGPGVGFDTLWFGSTEKETTAWQLNSEWALADGARSNLLDAVIVASSGTEIIQVPEPAPAAVLVLTLALFISVPRLRRGDLAAVEEF